MAVPPPGPPVARPPTPSVTREVSAPEQGSLVDASRPSGEVTTAAMGGAEMDALLSAEQAASPKNVIMTNTASAQAAAVMTRAERPDISFPSNPNEATVVLAPELTTPQPAQIAAPQPAGSPPDAYPAAVTASAPIAAPVRVLPSFAPPPPSRAGLFFVLGGATLLAIAVGAVVFGLRKGPVPSGDEPAASGPPPVPTAKTASTPSSKPAAPAGSTSAASTSATSTSAPASSPSSAPAGTREAEARAALAKLRDGVAACARDVIGVLPGTSPAVPAAFSMLKRGSYKVVSRDLRAPVFACIKYKDTGPTRFQIQWQMVQHPGEGRGVAWIDENGDGKADHAFGFRAALVRKNEVDLGEIGPLDPMPAVIKVP